MTWTIITLSKWPIITLPCSHLTSSVPLQYVVIPVKVAVHKHTLIVIPKVDRRIGQYITPRLRNSEVAMTTPVNRVYQLPHQSIIMHYPVDSLDKKIALPSTRTPHPSSMLRSC